MSEVNNFSYSLPEQGENPPSPLTLKHSYDLNSDPNCFIFEHKEPYSWEKLKKRIAPALNAKTIDVDENTLEELFTTVCNEKLLTCNLFYAFKQGVLQIEEKQLVSPHNITKRAPHIAVLETFNLNYSQLQTAVELFPHLEVELESIFSRSFDRYILTKKESAFFNQYNLVPCKISTNNLLILALTNPNNNTIYLVSISENSTSNLASAIIHTICKIHETSSYPLLPSYLFLHLDLATTANLLSSSEVKIKKLIDEGRIPSVDQPEHYGTHKIQIALNELVLFMKENPEEFSVSLSQLKENIEDYHLQGARNFVSKSRLPPTHESIKLLCAKIEELEQKNSLLKAKLELAEESNSAKKYEKTVIAAVDEVIKICSSTSSNPQKIGSEDFFGYIIHNHKFEDHKKAHRALADKIFKRLPEKFRRKKGERL